MEVYMHINNGIIWTTIVVLAAISYLGIKYKRSKKTSQQRETLLKTKANASWIRCSDSYYIFPFRKRLDMIAETLSRENHTLVYTRFNGCLVEFCTLRGGVLVLVSAHGDVGCAYEVVVTAPKIPDEVKALFEKLMPGKVIYRNLLLKSI